ncbi:MAG: hypothetical protein RJQ09_04910 [Cyclobacteriaceae bacterium]
MRVALAEIWDFVELAGDEKIKQVDLWLGKHEIADVSYQVIKEIRKGTDYDTELLPDLFTTSEITWQPNEYASHKDCLAGLNILKHQCESQAAAYKSKKSEISKFYGLLIEKMEAETNEALVKAENEETKLTRILGKFRKNIYPVIKFLLEHPANHPQIKFEATLRQDFMAKTLFNEYHVKFSDLINPCWIVWIGEKPPKKEPSTKETEEKEKPKKEETAKS